MTPVSPQLSPPQSLHLSPQAARERFAFSNLDEVLPLPDLISVQRASYQWFLDHGLTEAFSDISPIEDFSQTLRLELEFDATDPDLRPEPKFSVEECRERDMTFAARSSSGPAS